MIDLDRVQQIIEKEISPDFKISRYFDTEDMVIYFWTHKEYDPDDERGWIIGSGPVIYDKKTKAYRVMGSREWFSEEICKLFETEEGKERMNDHDYTRSLIEKIKANILRRKYVNSEDVDFLSILTGARRIDKEFNLISKPQWKFEEHIVVVSDNPVAQEKLMKIWKEIDFDCKLLSENELLLFRKKSIL
ncbi:hypothetical protein [uncultured Chryseobacterium sp.]|uniref:hypothetical protein n=1 Tax=uncultured Chryseobacterium sp. TaxID=259322 RepID=UPI00374966F9